MDEMKLFAEVISKSGLVPKDYQGKPANCFVAIQWGMECGLAPLQALQSSLLSTASHQYVRRRFTGNGTC